MKPSIIFLAIAVGAVLTVTGCESDKLELKPSIRVNCIGGGSPGPIRGRGSGDLDVGVRIKSGIVGPSDYLAFA